MPTLVYTAEGVIAWWKAHGITAPRDYDAHTVNGTVQKYTGVSGETTSEKYGVLDQYDDKYGIPSHHRPNIVIPPS